MTSPAESIHAWLRLSLVPGLGTTTLHRLIAELGSPTAILAASKTSLARLVDTSLAEAILRGPERPLFDAALTWASASHRALLAPDNSRYPPLLLETPDPPPILYAAGRIDLLARPAIAVVGSRNASAQGMRNAEAFARAISLARCGVVSGLALGIDTAAHRGGLSGPGSSIAILGNGIDVVYPRSNATLSAELMSQGLVLSEFPLGTPPLAANFPRRNRLISGIARGCLVVEAAMPSGSLITARLATELGRDVFAIPGSIHSPLAKGCHYLIKQGAKLVERAEDVLEELRIPAAAPIQAESLPVAAQETDQLLSALGYEPCTLDTLLERTGLSVEQLLAQLTQLEILGRVGALAGGRYLRIE